MKFITILPVFLLISSCDKEENYYSLDGFEYPEGIAVLDLESENDCALPKCSNQRIRRLSAKDVYGLVVNDSTINVTWQSDGHIKLHLCEKITSSLLDTTGTDVQKVLISGDLYDACGIVHHEWPTIEYYLFNLKDIKPYD